MKGDLVIARAFGGKPNIVRVWEVTQKVILICSEENYQILVNGKKGLFPVGVPREDVFRYNPSQEKMLRNWQRDPDLWKHLVNYV
jgi:hypothetical protein